MFDRPAGAVMHKPVECGIGDEEIARRVERAIVGQAIQNVEHAAVGDHQHLIPAMRGSNSLKGIPNALGKRVEAFTPRRDQRGDASLDASEDIGETLACFVAREPLQRAEMALAQIGAQFHRVIASSADTFSRLCRTRQIAAINTVEYVAGELWPAPGGVPFY